MKQTQKLTYQDKICFNSINQNDEVIYGIETKIPHSSGNNSIIQLRPLEREMT